MTRQRSNTEGSLRQVAPASAPPRGDDLHRPHSDMITSSHSFSDAQQLVGRSSSSNRITDMIRRPSFARNPSGTDISNKENYPSRSNTDLSSPTTLAYPQSPSNMTGHVVFVAPELTSETLMGMEHQQTLRKLQYVCRLIQCLYELALSRTSPLLESPRSSNKLSGCVVFVSEKQRRIEQLVLYIRALQILSNSLQLAKDEVAAGRLQPSPSVKEGKILPFHISLPCLIGVVYKHYSLKSHVWICSPINHPPYFL